MGDQNEGMLAFLGVPADRRLLDQDLVNLPAPEQYHEPAVVTHKHDRLVTAGSVLTGASLIGGAALVLYGGFEALFNGGGAFDVVVADAFAGAQTPAHLTSAEFTAAASRALTLACLPAPPGGSRCAS